MVAKAPQFGEDIVKFDSVAEMRIYIKRILEHFQAEVDRYGTRAGELMRERVKDEANANAHPTDSGNQKVPTWQRMGSLMMNTSDSKLGRNEVNLELLAAYKQKLKATADALRSFESVGQFRIEPGSAFILCLTEGVPTRIIVEKSPPSSA
jgi:hypothetical protein